MHREKAKMTLKELEFDSALQKQSIILRSKLLREPLGMVFSEEELLSESNQFHLAAIDGEEVIAVLLLVPSEDGIIKMRQVCVHSDHQNKGIGKDLVKFSEEFALSKGFSKMTLHARDVAVKFYLGMGYSIEGKPFTEVGIPHKKMRKNLTNN
jgi:predicted GNAT family N-acyltransferase